jgi:hypothetical protein
LIGAAVLVATDELTCKITRVEKGINYLQNHLSKIENTIEKLYRFITDILI